MVYVIDLVFGKAMDCDHPLIAYEIALTIRRLVQKLTLKDQTSPTWDLVFTITKKLLDFCGNSSWGSPLNF
jgi:hypothetical protein